MDHMGKGNRQDRRRAGGMKGRAARAVAAFMAIAMGSATAMPSYAAEPAILEETAAMDHAAQATGAGADAGAPGEGAVLEVQEAQEAAGAEALLGLEEADTAGAGAGAEMEADGAGSLHAEEAAASFLTEAQIGTRQALKEEREQLSRLEAGKDYADGRASFFTDTEEEAREVAASYGAELVQYSYGIARIRFPEGKGTAEALDGAIGDIDRVEEAGRELAASGALTDGAEGDVAALFEAGYTDIPAIPDVPVYPEIVYHINGTPKPEDDPLYAEGFVLGGQWHHFAMDMNSVWTKGLNGEGVTVAVIDSGVDTTHVDLAGVEALYVDSVDAGITSGEDDCGHGTHCVGLIAGNDNTIGGIGVAPGAKTISIKAADSEGALADPDIAAAILQAKSLGVDIISMSFGGPGDSALVRSAIKQALKAGIVCVAAAGNEATQEVMDDGTLGEPLKDYPAAYDGVLSVGWMTTSMTYAGNYGDWVDLAAPGSAVGSTLPNSKEATWYKKVHGNLDFPYSEGPGCAYGSMSGSSMATPIVAGVAALVKQAHPEYTAAQVREAIIQSSKVKMCKNKYFTTGRLNPLGAVEYVFDETNMPEEPTVPEDGDENGEGEGTVKPTDPGEAVPTDIAFAQDSYIAFGAGGEVAAKAGKTVDLRLQASDDINIKSTSDMRVDCGVYEDGELRMGDYRYCTPTSKPGVYKISKDAPAGTKIVVEAGYHRYKIDLDIRTAITVLPADAKTSAIKLAMSPSTASLSTVIGVGIHTGGIAFTSGDLGRAYCFAVDKPQVLALGGRLGFAGAVYGPETVIPVTAVGAGTATVTAYACDGSGKKATLKVTCASPLAEVQATYKGAAIGDEITMAKGATLALKAAALDYEGAKPKGKTTYAWSGENVKNGRITAPKAGGDFEVVLTARNGGITVEKRFTVHAVLDKKLSCLGYYAQNAKGKNVYYNSVTSECDTNGTAYVTGSRYGMAALPDLSGVTPKNAATALIGPKGFTKNGVAAGACEFYGDDVADYATNAGGLYAISVTGPSVQDVVRGEDGMVSFIPGKAGKYKVTFTSLDGSGKQAQVILAVKGTGSGTSNAGDEWQEVLRPGGYKDAKKK